MSDDAVETETLALLYLDQGHPDRAAPIFERLLAANPGRLTLVEGLAKCREALEVREVEACMEQKKRIDVMQQLLARLTGDSSQAAKAPESVSVESGINVEETIRAEKAPEPATASPGERKLQLLKSMLDRLGDH
jgi:tetratricopeptide repeat protein